MPLAEHVTEDGDVVVGVEHEGVFVPIQTIPAYRFDHYRERGEVLTERAKEGDAEAAHALTLVPVKTKSSSRAKSKEGDS